MISQHRTCQNKGLTYRCSHEPREHGQYTYGFDCKGNELNKDDVLVCFCCGAKGYAGLMSVLDWHIWDEGYDFHSSSWEKVAKEDLELLLNVSKLNVNGLQKKNVPEHMKQSTLGECNVSQ